MFEQDAVTDVGSEASLRLSTVLPIIYVSRTCAAHSESSFVSTEVGSCAALAVGGRSIRFCSMVVLSVRCTSRLVRMLVFVHLIYIYALTLSA